MGGWTVKLKECGLFHQIRLPIVSEDICKHVGTVKFDGIHNIATTVLVYPAYGDMQCSIMAAQPSKCEAVLNIGTSSQLSFILPKDNIIELYGKKYPGLTIVPFINGNVVVTAASLNGGNVIQSFVSFIQSFISNFTTSDAIVGETNIYKIIQDAGTKFKAEQSSALNELIKINPRLYGERFEPSTFASITNISSCNSSLGGITYSLCKGLIDNLHTMLPPELIEKYNIQSIVGTGGALCMNEVLQSIVVETFNKPYRSVVNGDASFGATLFCNRLNK